MKRIFSIVFAIVFCFLGMSVFSENALANSSTTGATFYKQVNYGGSEYFYPESENVVSLPSDLNDKFKSVKVGVTSKVLAWRHYSDSQPGQIYAEWTTDNPDIDQEIKGLSKFKVVPQESAAIIVRLLNGRQDGKKYCLYTNVSTVGDVETCTSDDYALVGIIEPKYFGQELVTQIAVKDENGVYLNNGSGYFSSKDGTSVSFDPKAGFPTNMSWTQTGSNTFDFYINN